MSKPYCGVRKVPKNRHLGTFIECSDRGQLRYYGMKDESFQISAILAAKKKIANEKAKLRRQKANEKKKEAINKIKQANDAVKNANKAEQEAKTAEKEAKKPAVKNTTAKKRGRPKKTV